MKRLSLLLLTLSAAAAWAAPNIHPDSSFEATGTVANARTGERAAALKVEKQSHWDASGGELDVTPFARYRITEWVKGTVSPGSNFMAPYVYGWDSYEWAFAGGRGLQTTKDWTQVEYTFVTPNTKMFVAPLAYIEAHDCDVVADDIVVEMIASPEEVMADLLGRGPRDENERKLAVRWLVQKGDLTAAAKIMDGSAGLTLADAATVIAGAIKDPTARLPYLVKILVGGGPTYHDGLTVFNRLATDLKPDQRLQVVVDALKANPNDDRTGRSVQMVLGSGTVVDPLAGVGDGLAKIEAQYEALKGAATAAPAGTPGAKALQESLAQLNQTLAALRTQQASLGKCVIRIGGKTVTPAGWAIVVPNRATPQEQYAARDLRHHLELVTGKLFAIKTERETGKGEGFFIGNTRKALKAGVKCEALGLEGIVIKTVGPSIILAGNQRGCLYATYQFLEDQLGCRWFTPDCATWPKTGTLNVGALDRKFIPPLEFRAGDYPIARNGTFSARLRLNGNNHQMTAEQGGRKGVHSLAHTFHALCPPEKYFATHPEYFSLVGGKRQSGYAQLCLTNPEVLEICKAGVRQWIKQNPDMKVFSVSQNDTDMHCECENCTKVAEEEGSQAGPVVRFVNAIADDIAKDYPDVAIETLAYQYTRKPVKVTRPRPNVIICLCSIECCFIHPLGEDEFNKTFAEDIRGWNKMCDRLWIWDYVINYAHSVCPFPNLQVLKPNINFFLKSGVKGIYEESCYWTPGSELQELRNYLMAKCLWDPKYDDAKATREFCDAFYGPASKPVQAYLELIKQSVLEVPKLHVQIYTHPKQYVFPDEIVKANALFDQAEAAVASDPVLLHRVQVARLPIMYAQIVLGTSGSFTEQDGKLVQSKGQDVGTLVDKFGEIARQEKITAIREGSGDLEAWLSSVPRAPRGINIESISNPLLKLDLLPALGGRIFRLTYLPDSRQLMRVSGTPEALSPTEGGYEEYTEGGYHSPGWSENYAVTAKTPTSITLAANLRSGLRLTRKYELDANKALVNLTSTLENIGKNGYKCSLRAHPEFAVSSTEKASVIVTGTNGKTTTINLANPSNPSVERDQWLRESDLPAGQWTLVDAGWGLSIVNRFNRDDVGVALLNRAGQQSRVNLELFGNEKELKPGESLQLRQSFEVVKQ